MISNTVAKLVLDQVWSLRDSFNGCGTLQLDNVKIEFNYWIDSVDEQLLAISVYDNTELLTMRTGPDWWVYEVMSAWFEEE